jgi:hypothetical protein
MRKRAAGRFRLPACYSHKKGPIMKRTLPRRRPRRKPTEDAVVKTPPPPEPQKFHEGQSVELVIGNRTDLGYKALINNSAEGMLYRNEVFQPLQKGDRVAGFIKKVREDGKIDLSLQKPGHERVDEVSDLVLEKLKAARGYLPVTDRTAPETIYGLFGVSKKTFKKAIGTLYKKRLILIESDGIRLTGSA